MSHMPRDITLMAVAAIYSTRGTCSRLQVGAVASRDGRVLTTGYNGAPSGLTHCDHSPDAKRPCDIAVHAEANAIAFAAKYGVALHDAELHVTHMPCLKCAQLIINAGISRVVFSHAYRDTSGVALLIDAHVIVHQLEKEPS